MPISETYNIDCMEYMKGITDKYFDLAIVDPPYGLGADMMSMGTNLLREGNGYPGESVAQRLRKVRYHGRGKLKNRIFNSSANKLESWDIKPSEEYFNQLFKISKNQIIWGGNYFNLPPTRGIICWDKIQPWDNFSQFELAWTSFNRPAAMFRYCNTGGANAEKKIHPTQKPIALYAWLLQNYAKLGDKIFDSHLGSGSSRIAAYKLGYDFWGCETDAEYYKSSQQRFKKECLGIITFSGKEIEQLNLFDE